MLIKHITCLVLFFFGFLFLSPLTRAQIIFHESAENADRAAAYSFGQTSSTRERVLLNGTWEVYLASDESKKKTPVSIPSVYEGSEELVFEKQLSLTPEQLKQYRMKLSFYGISYAAEISLNGNPLFRHPGGEFPFSVDLPNDLFNTSGDNLLSVKILPGEKAGITIPLKQSFLHPNFLPGIFRDVVLEFLPNIYIKSFDFSRTVSDNLNASVNYSVSVENLYFPSQNDTAPASNNFELAVSLLSNGSVISSVPNSPFEVKTGKQGQVKSSFDIQLPALWFPKAPVSYILQIQVLSGGVVIDEISRSVAFYSFKAGTDSLLINGSKFQMQGVTYVSSNGNFAQLLTYEQMEKDIIAIKDLGFNTVFFTDSPPHPYLLSLCEQHGLLAFIELPLSSAPDRLIDGSPFIETVKAYLREYLKAYRPFTSVAAIGLGSSYLGSSAEHLAFLNILTEEARTVTDRALFASFANLNFSAVPNVDMIGIELFNTPFLPLVKSFERIAQEFGKGKVFLSEAGLIAHKGTSNGYANPFTFEAQAKFFDEIITYSSDNYFAGFIFRTMFDYRARYSSFISGYSPERFVNLGILGEDRSTNRLSYKVIDSKLHNKERVTIPQGTLKDDSPMVFIMYGLALALFIGFLVNSGRKFREDAARALLRPYNFYADVRDQRVSSTFHTTVLAIIISATMALVTSGVLYSVRYSVFYEKTWLAAGSDRLMHLLSYLMWHPFESLLIITCLFFVFLLIVTLLARLFSVVVANKVFFLNAYYMVVWSFIPMLLLIPLGIVLPRLLLSDMVGIYLYALIFIFVIVCIHRLFKGTYVIYDTQPGRVYFYGFLILMLLLGSIIFYLQTSNNSLDFLLQVFQEWKVRN